MAENVGASAVPPNENQPFQIPITEQPSHPIKARIHLSYPVWRMKHMAEIMGQPSHPTKARVFRRYGSLSWEWIVECPCTYYCHTPAWSNAIWIANQHVYMEHRI